MAKTKEPSAASVGVRPRETPEDPEQFNIECGRRWLSAVQVRVHLPPHVLQRLEGRRWPRTRH